MIALEDDVPDYFVLSRFRTRLLAVQAWDSLLEQINQQIQAHDITVKNGYHVDVSILKGRANLNKPIYEVVNDREKHDDKPHAQEAMGVIEVAQPGVDTEACWVNKSGKSVVGYKQHTVVNGNGLVLVVEATTANCLDSKLLLSLLDKANIQLGNRIQTDKAYSVKSIVMLSESRGIKIVI